MGYGTKSKAIKSLTKMRRIPHKRKMIFFLGSFAIILIMFLHPYIYGMCYYDYIKIDNILDNLEEELAKNFTSSAISDCEYYENVLDETELSPSIVDGDLVANHRIKEGGEYAPSECKPKYSTAIIIPFKNRDEQLRGLLVYLHIFLRHQDIHYRIYVVEQLDSQPFNRAKLLNIGAAAAMKAGYPCLVLHNVDLLPLKLANLYVCTKQPRHMSSNVVKYRYLPSYQSCFGGVVSMTSSQFKSINGMSNKYSGWGGDDDDLNGRLEVRGLKVWSFEPEISLYHMMPHEPQYVYGQRNPELLSLVKQRMDTDGLNSLKYTEVVVVLHPLFTHIMVDP